MMGAALAFLYEIGAAVCHRLPERSFFGNGWQMPLCARCTGLYTGVFLGFCFLFGKGRRKGDAPFHIQEAALTAFALLPLAVDGFGSYIGLWESSQLSRVLTGAAAGAVLPGLLLLAGNFDPAGRPTRLIYAKSGELPLLLALSLLWGVLLWLGVPIYGVSAVFSAAGAGCFWTGVAHMLLRSVFPGRRLPFWRMAAGTAAWFFCILRLLA